MSDVYLWSIHREALPPVSGQCETNRCRRVARVYDHCHGHDTIRGRLCSQCNTDMRYLDHNAEQWASRLPYLMGIWLRCEQCRVSFRDQRPGRALLQECATGQFAPLAGNPWATFPVKMPEDMKRDLERAKVDDHIETGPRIRAMITLWRQDEQYRAAVNELAQRRKRT